MSITNYNDKVIDPKYLNWIEYPMTFTRADQWADIPYPRHFPLVLDPTIRNMRLKKVLIDGGSALNILFVRTITDLGLRRTISFC